MKLAATAATALALASLAAAVPATFRTAGTFLTRRGEPKLASQIILEIAPTTKDCEKEPAKGQCATNVESAPYLIEAMAKYKLFHAAQIAAVLSNQLFESVELKYNRNISPGRPGQGTRNMQMPGFNFEYAKSQDDLKGKLPAGNSTEGMSNEDLDKILDLVMIPEHTYATGPWFMRNKCKKSVLDLLTTDYDKGFLAFMDCVGIEEVTEDRKEYWGRAKDAFGLK